MFETYKVIKWAPLYNAPRPFSITNCATLTLVKTNLAFLYCEVWDSCTNIGWKQVLLEIAWINLPFLPLVYIISTPWVSMGTFQHD